MLNSSEKAYYRALLGLKNKDYGLAAEEFDRAEPYFRRDAEFSLLRETTRLLVTVKDELARLEKDGELLIEEVFTDG